MSDLQRYLQYRYDQTKAQAQEWPPHSAKARCAQARMHELKQAADQFHMYIKG